MPPRELTKVTFQNSQADLCFVAMMSMGVANQLHVKCRVEHPTSLQVYSISLCGVDNDSYVNCFQKIDIHSQYLVYKTAADKSLNKIAQN